MNLRRERLLAGLPSSRLKRLRHAISSEPDAVSVPARATREQRIRSELDAGAVLTGANTSTRKRPRTRANAIALKPRKPLQTRRKAPMLAKSEHQSCGLDKLRVTGSSPIPPMKKPCSRAFLLLR
jgi:hypothetical protein